MSKKEKLQSKKTDCQNSSGEYFGKKINGRSFNSEEKIYNSKEFDEKSSTVESETTVILQEKTK